MHKLQADLFNLKEKLATRYMSICWESQTLKWSSHAGQFDVALRLKNEPRAVTPRAVTGLNEANNETRRSLHGSQRDTFLHAKSRRSEVVKGDE